MKLIGNLVFGIILIFFLSSCEKKGCTDPNAVNYDITANKDDGSCIVCQTNTILYDSVELPLVDKKPSSIYYNDTVGIFHFYQYLEYPSDKVCGVESSYITLDLQNLVNQNMQVDFNIEKVTGPVSIYYGSIAFVGPLQTFEFGRITTMNFPPFYKLSMDSLRVTVTGYIQYN